MRTLATATIGTGIAVSVLALILLMSGRWDLATYFLMAAGALLIAGALIGIVASATRAKRGL